MKVLVTGGAGYIGSHLADYFPAQDYTVTVVDNLYTGSMGNIEQNPANPRFSFVKGNILDKTLVDKLAEGHDLICHLAAALGEAFNTGNDAVVTINDLAGPALRLTGSSSPVTYAPYAQGYGPNFKDMTRIVDSSKAERILGFRAKTALEEGVAKLMPWFTENLHLARR
jgi:nucleoside-diphosphate-sugar epimerase